VKLSGGRLVDAEIKARLAASFLLNESVSEPEKSRNKVTYSLVPPQQPPFEIPPVLSEHPEREGQGDTVVITSSQIGASGPNVSASATGQFEALKQVSASAGVPFENV